MTSQEFEVELKKLDPRFSVVENQNRPGLSNIFFEGKNFDLPVVSTHLIKDEVDYTHRYQFPNGLFARMHSRPEILERINRFFGDYKAGMYEGYED